MPFDRHLISPMNSGLQTNMRPWRIMDDAFEYYQNAVTFRGRVRKRPGTLLMNNTTDPNLSRFRINLGNTTAGGDFAVAGGALPGDPSTWGIGTQFSIGDEIFTVAALGTPVVMLDTGSPAVGVPVFATTKTFNTSTGALTIVGSPLGAGVPVYFYPSQPVMGLTNYQVSANNNDFNNKPSYGFDTRFAYKFTAGWSISGPNPVVTPFPAVPGSRVTANSVLFHGQNYQGFWTDNYIDIADNLATMYVTNNNVNIGLGLITDDTIWYMKNDVWAPMGFAPLQPPAAGETPKTIIRSSLGTGSNSVLAFVQGALIVVAFKNHLLLLNTIENEGAERADFETWADTAAMGYYASTNELFVNRCRYSSFGSPLARGAWLEQNQTYNDGTDDILWQGGGFIDAATDQTIISCEFVKDHLIVYFNQSSWEIVYTNNEIAPFIWQKINTELGSLSTFSTIPFDKFILATGNTGINSCTGANTERIDALIPDEVFDFASRDNGIKRVWGVRDYFSEIVYWTFPQVGVNKADQVFPNQVLVFNYQNNTWSLIDDVFTAFGYFQQQVDRTWQDSSDITWENANFAWSTGSLAANFRQILCGTPTGFVLVLEDTISGTVGRNTACAYITNITNPNTNTMRLTIVNHMLITGQFIAIERLRPGNTITTNTETTENFYQVIYVDKDTVDIAQTQFSSTAPTGAYTGGATMARISRIDIYSKQWNPYVDNDRNFYVQQINFGLTPTASGRVTVGYFPSYSEFDITSAANASEAAMGDGVLETSPYDPALYPLEQFQTLLWHPVYFMQDGESIQIRIYLSDDQMIRSDTAWVDFELQGLILYTKPTSTRLE